ncbi:hypothetical protein ABTX81_21560 [Kitasatospora sp. NPDC097605]|uniref:hypothetical protein n=1 Tax=Kitasatospora sp. NPDC097605 TaxID=3157226 RepID=UPI003321B754
MIKELRNGFFIKNGDDYIGMRTDESGLYLPINNKIDQKDGLWIAVPDRALESYYILANQGYAAEVGRENSDEVVARADGTGVAFRLEAVDGEKNAYRIRDKEDGKWVVLDTGKQGVVRRRPSVSYLPPEASDIFTIEPLPL